MTKTRGLSKKTSKPTGEKDTGQGRKGNRSGRDQAQRPHRAGLTSICWSYRLPAGGGGREWWWTTGDSRGRLDTRNELVPILDTASKENQSHSYL